MSGISIAVICFFLGAIAIVAVTDRSKNNLRFDQLEDIDRDIAELENSLLAEMDKLSQSDWSDPAGVISKLGESERALEDLVYRKVITEKSVHGELHSLRAREEAYVRMLKGQTRAGCPQCYPAGEPREVKINSLENKIWLVQRKIADLL